MKHATAAEEMMSITCARARELPGRSSPRPAPAHHCQWPLCTCCHTPAQHADHELPHCIAIRDCVIIRQLLILHTVRNTQEGGRTRGLLTKSRPMNRVPSSASTTLGANTLSPVSRPCKLLHFLRCHQSSSLHVGLLNASAQCLQDSVCPNL